MNDIRLSFLRALALSTRFDFLQESPRQRPKAFWLVLVRALQGLAYAIIAAFISWLLRSPLLAAFLGTVAILLAHCFIAGPQDFSLPVTVRRALIPGDNPTWDLLANLLLPLLIFLAIHSEIISWLPAILASGTTAGMEFYAKEGDAPQKGLFLQNYPCWLVATATFLLFAVLPCLGNDDCARVALLRGFFLVAGLFILMPALKHTQLKAIPRQASCLLGTILAYLLALIANAL